jgi:hypothetical protein
MVALVVAAAVSTVANTMNPPVQVHSFPNTSTFLTGQMYRGYSYRELYDLSNPIQCRRACEADSQCMTWTYTTRNGKGFKAGMSRPRAHPPARRRLSRPHGSVMPVCRRLVHHARLPDGQTGSKQLRYFHAPLPAYAHPRGARHACSGTCGFVKRESESSVDQRLVNATARNTTAPSASPTIAPSTSYPTLMPTAHPVLPPPAAPTMPGTVQPPPQPYTYSHGHAVIRHIT